MQDRKIYELFMMIINNNIINYIYLQTIVNIWIKNIIKVTI